jgi:hypothetical protein
MRISDEEYRAILSRPAMARANQAGGESACAVVECPVGNGPLETPQVKEVHSGRYVVRVRSYRTILLDEDNLAEKYHVDACRYAGLIPSDAPDHTRIEVSQEKVTGKDQCRTEIEITKET